MPKGDQTKKSANPETDRGERDEGERNKGDIGVGSPESNMEKAVATDGAITDAMEPSTDQSIGGAVETKAKETGLALATAIKPIPPEGAEATAKRATVAEILKGAESSKRLREGPCIFLMLDLTTPLNKEQQAKIAKEVELANRSQDYHVSLSQGWLIIIGTAERATSSLANIAKSILRISPTARVILSDGVIKHTGANAFNLEGRPDQTTAESFRQADAGIYLTPTLKARVDDPETREGSHCKIDSKLPNEVGLIPVVDIRAKVSQKIGGPDKAIGIQDKVRRLEEILKDPDKRYISLTGEAGIGKTRLLLETLDKFPNAFIWCVFDAGDRNKPDAGLVTVAQQIANAEIEAFKYLRGQDPKTALHTFLTQKTYAEQVEEAARNPLKLVELCAESLARISYMLETTCPLLILEDLHNCDRWSLTAICRLAGDYLGDPYTSQTGYEEKKVITVRRPEDMYKSGAERDLEKNVSSYWGAEAVEKIVVEGLDFAAGTDPETGRPLSYEYAWHCLPEDLRRGRTLGNWHKIIANAAGRNPFFFNYYLRSILADPDNLEISDTTINVKSGALEEIGKIKPDDQSAQVTYIYERINRLPVRTRQILQAIALAGGKLTEEQIQNIIAGFSNRPEEAIGPITAQLVEGGYLIIEKAKDDQAPPIYRLQNEILCKLAVNSIDEQEKAAMITFLDLSLSADPNIHPDIPFTLRHGLATSTSAPGLNDDDFWQKYAEAAKKAFEKDSNQRLTGPAFHRGSSIIDEVNAVKHTIHTLNSYATGSPELNTLPEGAITIAVSSLFAIAKNGVYLGRFEEAEAALATLEQIAKNHPDLVTIGEVTLIRFENAYAGRKTDEMAALIDTIRNDATIPEVIKTAAEIKLAYRERKFSDIERIYEQKENLLQQLDREHRADHEEMPSPEVAEIERLVRLLMPFDKFQQAVKQRDPNTTLDEDVDYQPGVLTIDHAKKLKSLFVALREIKSLQEKFPTLYDPYAELSIVGTEAELTAYTRGKLEAAINLAREAWRIADQMEVHDEAARYAKISGDLYVQSGQPQKALEVYNLQLKISASHLDDKNFFKWVKGPQIIRATSLRALQILKPGEAITPEQKTQIREDISKAINEEFKNLNRLVSNIGGLNNLAELLEMEPEERKQARKLISYYVMGHFGQLVIAAKKLQIPLPEALEQTLQRLSTESSREYPLLDIEFIRDGEEFADNITDLGLGQIEIGQPRQLSERQIKVQGLRYLRDLGAYYRDKTLKAQVRS